MVRDGQPAVDRRQFLKVAGAAGGASVLAGCSGETGGDTDGESPATDDSTGTDTTVEQTTEKPSEVKTGGELVVTVASQAQTLNPHLGDQTTDSALAQAYSNSLLRFEQDGTIAGDLATDYTVSEDGTTYTLTLHEGVQFHGDYGECDAEAVRESFLKIITDKEYGAVNRGEFEGILWGEGPDGNQLDPASRITATGTYEIEFSLAKRDVTFPSKLTSYRTAVLPVEALDEHGEDFGTFDTGVWATGPFQFESAAASGPYEFSANPDYFKETEAGQLPYLDGVRYSVVPDGTVRNTKLKTGEAHVNPTVPANKVKDLENAGEVEVLSMPSVERINMYINWRNVEPMGKKKVRHALGHASNRQAIKSVKFAGRADPAWSVFPPWHWAYDEDAVSKYPYDIDRAKSLMEEAGEGDGFSLEVDVTNQPKFVDIAQILQQSYKKIGVDMSINPKEKGSVWGPWYPSEWDDEDEKEENREVGPPPEVEALIESIGYGFSADGYAYLGFHTRGYFNSSFYGDDEVDQWLEAARRTTDRAERKELYRKVQQKVTEFYPLIMQVWPHTNQGRRSDVKNYIAYPTRTPHVEQVFIDE
ncbi:ABC transporter substrate-binding protein [Haloarchaeobius amylolyticus]|uniref:ABC transporter substrate-binding protein n=1 Tax=Haloarchaeobius amylolyticus TaxID=1198296 RepID=UPI00226DFD93|nr:ABC transporter substrate-binding protein [Haloarchaeobius amylolyticus]